MNSQESKTMKTVLLSLLILATVVMAGCNTTRASQRAPAPVAVVKPVPEEVYAPKKGSIWQTTDSNTLFLDNKARNIGDIVTVQVSETSSAQKNASTDLKRENEDAFDLGGLFGLTAALVGRGNTFFDDSATLSGSHNFSGDGQTTRQGAFTATISCQVIEVLPNGNLRVEGRRDITVNNENQFIILSGIIRPEDITPANAVTSAQIADARIEYSGDGDLNDQQKPGWVNQFFSAFNIM